MAMAVRSGGWRAPTQGENPLGGAFKWGRQPPPLPVSGVGGDDAPEPAGMMGAGGAMSEMPSAMPWFSSGTAPAPSASAASPAMAGLLSALQPQDTAPGMRASGDGMMDPRVGQRTPPQAMRILSQLTKVY